MKKKIIKHPKRFWCNYLEFDDGYYCNYYTRYLSDKVAEFKCMEMKKKKGESE